MHALTLLFTVLLVLLIVAVLLFKPLKKAIKRRRFRYIFIAAIVAVSSGLVASIILQKDSATDKKPTVKIVEDSKKTQPKISAQANLPAYEILQEAKTNNSKRLTVYILEKDRSKVTALNKYLFEQHQKAPITKLSIDYFDDRTIAGAYFDQIKAEGITTDQKKQLVSHYIAISTTELTTPDKILFLSESADISTQLQNSSSGAAQ